jgi:hypothetical protein
LQDKPPESNDEHDIWSIVSQLPVTDQKLEEIRQVTSRDPVIIKVKEFVTSGWPERQSNVQQEVRPYFTFRDEIADCDGILFRGNQILIPKAMQPQMLQKLHASHQGIVKNETWLLVDFIIHHNHN